MNSAFKAFELPKPSSKPGDANFKMRIVPKEENQGAFRSMTEAFGLAPRSENSGQSAPATQASCGHGSEEAKPRVMLKKEGDRIVQIQIICGCGRLLELDCLYS